MQSVAEFMKKCGHFIKREQAWRFRSGLGKVAHNANVRTDVLPFFPFLSAVAGHPGTVAFAFSGKEISIEKCQVAVIFVQHLIGNHIRVVLIYVLAFNKGDSIQQMRHIKHAIDYVFKFEIWFQQFVINAEFGLLQFFCVIAKVPLAEVFQTICFPGKFLHGFKVFLCCRTRMCEQFVQEFLYSIRGFGHALFQHKVCMAVVAQQLCTFFALLGDAFHRFAIVMFFFAIGAAAKGLGQFFAKCTVFGIGHKRHVARGIKGNYPSAFLAAMSSFFGSSVSGKLW